jgi:hypothetical protein
MARQESKMAVREPVQVYLTAADRALLRDVAAAAGISGAEVLRRGLRRMAGEVLGEQGPAMRLLQEMNSANWPEDMPADVGLRHDQHVSEAAYPAPKRARRKK